ncbi:MAG: hypothetical protein R3C14_06990 [Caldilineaceae bacterium]
MRRRTFDFDSRHFVRCTEGQLVVAFFVLLYGVGGGLIWFFYGRAAALLGIGCMTGGLLFFLLLYGILLLIGHWAGE